MITKEKAMSSLVFAIFLTGSTILYYELGRLVALGVALEILSIYILIKLEIKSLLGKQDKFEGEE